MAAKEDSRALVNIFGGLKAVNHVDSGSAAGQVSVIIGTERCAGKNDLFNLLRWTIPATEGEIWVG